MSAPPQVEIDPIHPQPTLLNNPRALENLTSVIAIPDIPRPGYLEPVELTGYGTKITRIGGDYGQPTAIGGTWGKDSRHHYSKDQPWNDDESMLWIENNAEPTKMILDGLTYEPIMGSWSGCTNYSALLRSSYDLRWRPTHATQMVSWNKSTHRIVLWDVLTQAVIWDQFIGSADPNFGMLGEGVLSDDGRFVVLCSTWDNPTVSPIKTDQFCVVDLDNQLVGPITNVPAMPYHTSKYGKIGWASISPLGNFVIVKYAGSPEYHRCFDVNPVTLALTPHTFLLADQPLQAVLARGNMAGWMGSMSHSDFQLSASPTLTGVDLVEVVIGGIRDQSNSAFCSDTYTTDHGHVIAQSMATGKHVHISRGRTQFGGGLKEAEDQHFSGRNYLESDYMLTTYTWDARVDRRLSDELVIYATDAALNGGRVIRLGTTRTNDSSLGSESGAGGYRAESHGVPSPTFSKVLYASTWQRNTTTPGAVDQPKGYILESLEDLPAVGAPEPDPHTEPTVE